ncbi:hypothetical protein NKJ55_15130 [Mesorhizobium sp. M0106]|uniref:hypothetical protein n=1 Tax=Mesorhizobium sp. M0106 TaxID=2956880 RepID=UPI003336CAE5
MTIGISAIPALSRTMQGEEMLEPEEVAAMLRLHELGWGRSDWRRNPIWPSHRSQFLAARRAILRRVEPKHGSILWTTSAMGLVRPDPQHVLDGVLALPGRSADFVARRAKDVRNRARSEEAIVGVLGPVPFSLPNHKMPHNLTRYSVKMAYL